MQATGDPALTQNLAPDRSVTWEIGVCAVLPRLVSGVLAAMSGLVLRRRHRSTRRARRRTAG